ncbi:MAG: transporter substrate-binding domain-containing protein [Oscillospiraceae bacterium]
MKSKKILSLLLALAMSLSLVACGGGDEPQDEGGEEEKDYASMTIDELKAEIQTVTEGKLTMATSPDFAPYEFYALDEDGTPTLAGFDIALGQYIADYLGLELEIIPMDFDGTIAELAAKSVDIGMAGYSPDPAREDKMDFSDVYYTGGQSFVCLQSNKELFATLADANKAEYQIGAQIGSIQVGLAEANTPDADIVQLAKVTDIVAELLSGKLDGAFIETDVAVSYAKNYPDLCVLHDVPYEQEGSVVGVSKGNEPLLLAINMAIASALADGSMANFVAEANELAGGATASLVDGEIVAD